jgi:hypothetical protein
VGENTNRATLNYTTREFYNEKLEVQCRPFTLGCRACAFHPYCTKLGTAATKEIGRSEAPRGRLLACGPNLFITIEKTVQKKSVPKI